MVWQDCKRLANVLETWRHAKTSTTTANVSESGTQNLCGTAGIDSESLHPGRKLLGVLKSQKLVSRILVAWQDLQKACQDSRKLVAWQYIIGLLGSHNLVARILVAWQDFPRACQGDRLILVVWQDLHKVCQDSRILVAWKDYLVSLPSSRNLAT